MSEAERFADAVVGFVRGFGLHRPERTPCELDAGVAEVNARLERVGCQHIIDSVQTKAPDFGRIVEALLTKVRDLLDSANARDRVRAMHHLAAGVATLEHQVLLDAQAAGMTWAEIGNVYGVSRQAAHRKFSGETVVSSDYFDGVLEELDADAEVVPALTRAAERARRAAASR